MLLRTLALLLVGSLAAQTAARRPLFGLVRGVDGPIAAATVTLVGFDASFDPVFDSADVVEVRADATGRFRAQVRRGLPYLGFACGPADATGAVARSRIEGWFGAGAVVEFACAAPDGPYAVTFVGLEAWAGAAPLLAVARAGDRRLLPMTRAATLGDAGQARWPALSPGAWELCAKDGWPLLSQPALPCAAAVLTVRPPRELPCRVTDELGQPVDGAELWWRGDAFVDDAPDGVQTLRSRMRWRVGTTGADGRARLRLPIDDPFAAGSSADVLLTANAPGRQERLSGCQRSACYRDDRRVERDLLVAAGEVPFALPPARASSSALRFAGAPFAAGGEVRLQVVARLHTGDRAFVHDLRCHRAAVGAGGEFAFPGVPADAYAVRLSIVDPDGGLPLSLPPVAGADLGAAIDLAAAATLQLTVLDVHRGPAAGQVFYLVQETTDAEPTMATTARWCADGAGRAEVRLWPGAWFVFAADDQGCAWRRLDVHPGEAAALELPLDPYPRLAIALADAGGAAVGGARVEVAETSVASGKDRERELAQSFLRRQLGLRLCRLGTAADGTLSLPCPPIAGLTIDVELTDGVRRTPRLPLQPRGEPLALRWR